MLKTVIRNIGTSRRAVLAGMASAVALGFGVRANAEVKSVKLGLIYPMTGIFAYNGELSMIGAQLAADEINAAGGIKSLGGAKLELVGGNSQSKPDAASIEVEKLADAGVSVFLGGYASGITLTASQTAAKRGVPFIADCAASDEITSRKLPGVFRFGPGFANITSTAVANLVALNERAGKPVKTVALVHEDGAFGGSMAKILAAELPKAGFEVVAEIPFPTPTRDFNNIALKLKSAAADIIVPSCYLNEYVLFARAISQQRVPHKVIYSVIGGGATNYKFIRENNAAAQYIIDTTHWVDPKKERTKRLMKILEAAGHDLTYEIMLNYSATLLIADAIERAGSADATKISEAIATSKFDDHVMPYGPTEFIEGANAGARAVSTQIQGQAVEVIYPLDVASAEAVFPKPQ